MESRIIFLIILLLVVWFLFTSAGKDTLARIVQGVKGEE